MSEIFGECVVAEGVDDVAAAVDIVSSYFEDGECCCCYVLLLMREKCDLYWHDVICCAVEQEIDWDEAVLNSEFHSFVFCCFLV